MNKRKRKIRWDRVAIVVGIIVLLISPFAYKSAILKKQKTNTIKPKVTETKSKVEEKKFTVALDPGHGGYDSGSSSKKGVLEKDLTLKVALLVGELLKKENIDVVYTRTSDEVSWSEDNVEDLYARCEIVNEGKADAFVSIHFNFSEEMQDKTYGSEVWYSSSNPGGEKFATIMEKALKDDNYTVSRGVRNDKESPIYIFYLSKMPTILIEAGFISNDKDMKVINSEQGQKRIAEAIETGILNYLKTQ